MRHDASGFSLVELMVALSIIGVLSAQANTTYQANIKFALAKSQAKTLAKQVTALREARDLPLFQITGNTCTACSCVSGVWQSAGSSWAAQNQSCIDANNTSWKNLGFATAPRDPWGNVFMLEENEWEFGENDCRNDVIFFVNPKTKNTSTTVLPNLRCSTDVTQDYLQNE